MHGQTKILAYLVWTAGIIVDSQRQGIVTLIWVHESFQVSQVRTLIQYRFVELSPTRIASIHFCTPDTPFHLFRRSALAIRLGIYRNRLVLSAGSTVELNYILQSYGIPTDTIPITYSGTIKVTPMRQWIRLRYLLEEPDHQESAESSSIVECPYLSDIMFRQGTNACSHPGNATFRALIATKYQEFCNSKDFKSNYKQGSRIFIEGIIEDIEESQMRVINWNDKQGYWKVLNDKSLIYPKIEYIVRELRTADKARLNQQKNDSSTSLFQEMDDGNGRKFVGINQAQEPSTNNTNAVAEKDDEVGCFATCFATDSNEEAQLNGP
uniref:Uncharacterized protein n=1 Tax=Pseudo-nitzschia australis TaxID=44445 RepID=A0A7S4EFJ1_9STRA